MPTQDAYRWIDQHDDRLTRLEDQSRDMSAQTAANTAALEALKDEVKEGFAQLRTQIGTKLDDAQATKVEVQAIKSKVEVLETNRKDHRGWVSSVVTGVIVGVLVLVTKALAGL
jgi:hypothetical protein